MAKQIGEFELVIRGGGGEPTKMFRRYRVEDADDPTLFKMVDEEIDTPTFNKTFHGNGSIGEIWKDEVDTAKTNNGIS